MPRQLLRFSCIMAGAVLGAACSVPNLESSQCTAARDVVKRFYSYHFANDLGPSADNLEDRRGFLTERLSGELADRTPDQEDYFTKTLDHPRAFRVGSCNSGSDDTATLEVVLLWRDDTRSEQKEVRVQTVRTGDRWLIESVSN